MLIMLLEGNIWKNMFASNLVQTNMQLLQVNIYELIIHMLKTFLYVYTKVNIT